MRRLLLISFDAVGDKHLPRLMQRPHFAALARRAAVRRGVDSVFISNTYPVHSSVATGLVPQRHGMVRNTAPFPARHPQWHYTEDNIKAETLWQAAARQGRRVAAVMWPVTGGSRTIRWNIPELMAQPGQNQVLLNLRYGSALLQMGCYLRHRHLLRGIAQPQRDAFATACMADILRKKRPDLALMHLTAFDSLCHHYGLDSPKLETALDSLDENLGILLGAAGDVDVIVFSDHAQLPAQNPVLPNEILRRRGWLPADSGGAYLPEGGKNCFFECAGGSAFLHPGDLNPAEIDTVRAAVEELEGFARFLRCDELEQGGFASLPFGFCVQPGHACESYASGEKANHGYPLEYAGYQVFYLAAGQGVVPGEAQGGSLLDIAPMAADILKINMNFT